MAHAITERKNGKAEMAYKGEVPWHGLGQQLVGGESIEQWSVAAGMDWKVNRSRVRYGDGDNQKIFDDHHVLFRSDTKAPLGIVSPKFKIVQPAQVLEFFRDLVGGSGFELETAGTLFGGRRFWALASIGESAVILNSSDLVGGYLLLCTGVDGTLATTGRLTTVRVVCNNTLSMALGGSSVGEMTLSHRSHFDPTTFKAGLGVAHGQFATFTKQMRDLAKVKVTETVADRMTLALLAPKSAAEQTLAEQAAVVEKVRESKHYTSIMGLFKGEGKGAKMDGVAETAWGWLNAVTEHYDFHARAATADNRLDSAWFGRGADAKQEAAKIALSRVPA